MAISALSFPVDIPWRRLCVSADMLDRRFCDRSFPYRWRSSVAVFGYEPPEDQQQYEELTVSYLKVVCTITGFQPDPTEVGLKDRRVDSYWNDPAVILNYRELVTQYYGCYGAILEVAVAPGSAQRELPVTKYPYFVDFEPKKRELYETVSDTGETMSRSLEDVNVRKGTTTSDSHEVVDRFGGVAASFTYGGTGGGITPQGQVGHTDMNEEERANIHTTDSSRESRETFSHTTQLTQMYHQLNSYHLGTNRAVFFILPRPHIVQSETDEIDDGRSITFANGPRLLEGIQEFFLVVARPKEIEHVCVEAYLETAHIASEPQHKYEESIATVPLHVEKRLTVDRDCFNCYGDDGYYEDLYKSEPYVPPAGWEIDLDKNGGYKPETPSGTNILSYGVSEIDRNHAIVYGSVRAQFLDKDWPQPNQFYDGVLDIDFTIYIRKKIPAIVGYSQNLWLTGRGICCCESDDPGRDIHLRESVTYETRLPSDIRVAIGGKEKVKTQDANTLRGAIGNELRRSVNHPARFPKGTTGFLDTAFLGRTVASLVRNPGHPDNGTLTNIPGLGDSVTAKIRRVAPRISRGKLLEMPAEEIGDRFGLTLDEVRRVRRASLGLAGEVPSKAERWDRRGAYGNATVPDVVGLRVDEARSRIRAAQLAADMTEYIDSPLPRDTVLQQSPEPGSVVAKRSEVPLKLSSGAAVQIPDLIGKSLIDGICLLRAAGLTADPEIRYIGECDTPRIVRVEPKPRSFVTPNERVVLELGEA
jgi:hypothetical protein